MSDITKFAFDISDESFEESRNKYALSLSHMIEKYGEEEGTKKWKNYCDRQRETNTFEYKQQKYGWTKKEFDEYNLSRAVTLNNLIKRYGEDEGKERWKNYCDRQRETKSWEYMVEHYGEKKARDIINQRLTGINTTGFSKISQQLFEELDKYFCPNYNTQYATKGGEYEVVDDKWTFKLDYYIKELNCCIEFNGSVFHADPELFDSNDHPNPFSPNLTSEEIWNKDEFRIKTIKDHGITTYVIWEREYPGIDLKKFTNKIIKEQQSSHI